GRLLQAFARFAHERDRFREHDRHHRANLLGLLLGCALDVDAVDRRDREVDRKLYRVVRPGETLGALHLLGELAQPALKVVRAAEEIAESTAFHAANGSRLRDHPRIAAVGRRRFRCAVRVAHVHWRASPMTADEQLLYEARVRPRQAVIAGLAAAAL